MDSLLSYFINLLISSLESDYNVPLSSISDQINKATRGLDVTVAAFQLVLFLAICFFGYKILKILITIDGALTGLIIGIVAGVFLVNATGLESWVILADSFVFMLLFGFLAFKLYRLGVFLHYFLCGTLVFGVILALFKVEDIWVIIGVSAGFGIIIGILALIFNKIYIIISSALIGGLCAGDAIGVLVETDKDGVKILIGLIIAIAGAVFQFWYENKRTNNVIETDITNENYISSIKDKMGAKVFCAKCGTPSSAENRFCPVCGNDMYSSKLSYHTQNDEIAVPTNIVFTGNEDKGTLKIRMNDALEDGRWGEALLFAERIITTDAEDGEGYLGGLLAECRISNIDSIVQMGNVLSKSKYYKGFTKYASHDLIEKVKENVDKANDIQENKNIEILNTLIDGIKVFKNKQKEEEIIETSLKNKKGTSKGVLLNIIGIFCSILFWIMVIFRLLEIILPYEFTVKNTYVYGGTEYRNLILSDFNFARQFFDPNVWLDNVWYKSNMPNIVWTLLYYGVLIFLGNMFLFQVKRRKGRKREISKNRQSYKSAMEEEQQILGAMVPFLACIPITLRDDVEIATVLGDYKKTNFNTENNKKTSITEIIENYSGDINKIDKKISVIPYEGINDLNLKYDYLSELQKVIESMGANLLTSNFEETNGMTSIGNSMQRCSACGTAVEAGACFCNKCGAKIVQQIQFENDGGDKKEKRLKKVFIIVPVILVMAVLICTIAYFIKDNNDGKGGNNQTDTRASDERNRNESDYSDNLGYSNNSKLFGENENTSTNVEIAQAYIDAINSGQIIIDDMDTPTIQYEIDDMDGDDKIDLLIGCYCLCYDSNFDNYSYDMEYRIYSYDNNQIKQICDFKSFNTEDRVYSYSKKTKLFYEDVDNCGLVAIYELKNGELLKTDYQPGVEMYYSKDYEPSALCNYGTREQLIEMLSNY